MDREVEIKLIEQFLDLKSRNTAFLDHSVTRQPIKHYTERQHFECEMEQIFTRRPNAIAHVSQFTKAGDFVRRDVYGRSLLLVRQKSGDIKVFHNVCRHRGTRLVDAQKGCKRRFTCPYHAWTYDSDGNLIAAPHYEQGFGNLDKSTLSLKPVSCVEKFGFIWVGLTDEGPLKLDQYFEDLTPELEALFIEDMEIAGESTRLCHANWKILVEGGIESYHFKVAHSKTIAPYFEDNMSTYEVFGIHMRNILPRTSMIELEHMKREDWKLRDHANIIYTLFPTTQLLVQKDHIIWIHQQPVAPDKTNIRMVTLVPKPAQDRQDYWSKNHAITTNTLDEDFDIGETIQSGLKSGANEHMLFARFEGALDQFNRVVLSHL